MDPIVGIDLGTTNSVVACWDEAGNRARVLTDDRGVGIHPSVVSFHPNGSVIVGAEAKQRRIIDPRNTVYSAKRLIGRTFRSREVQTAASRMPYPIREGANQQPTVVTRAGEWVGREGLIVGGAASSGPLVRRTQMAECQALSVQLAAATGDLKRRQLELQSEQSTAEREIADRSEALPHRHHARARQPPYVRTPPHDAPAPQQQQGEWREQHPQVDRGCEAERVERQRGQHYPLRSFGAALPASPPAGFFSPCSSGM